MKGDALDQYVERFLDLFEVTLDCDDERVDRFIQGMNGEGRRREIRKHVFEKRTIGAVRDYAHHFDTQNRMETALELTLKTRKEQGRIRNLSMLPKRRSRNRRVDPTNQLDLSNQNRIPTAPVSVSLMRGSGML